MSYSIKSNCKVLHIAYYDSSDVPSFEGRLDSPNFRASLIYTSADEAKEDLFKYNQFPVLIFHVYLIGEELYRGENRMDACKVIEDYFTVNNDK